MNKLFVSATFAIGILAASAATTEAGYPSAPKS
jgi:hypothetical protein